MNKEARKSASAGVNAGTRGKNAQPTKSTTPSYKHLNLRMGIQLAAPHTWPAAVFPVLIATAGAFASQGSVSYPMTCTLLIICVLMQSAANTFNDYYDYIKGSDSADDNVDPTDAVLVYNNINPTEALSLAIGFLVCAFLLGIYVIVCAGFIPLLLGIAGAIVVILYSAGKTPISYLPIGELISGFFMGSLIPFACYLALTNTLEPLVFLWSVPLIIGIALIMLTNNTCDIEKDIQAKRKTLSCMLGRTRARNLYHICLGVWLLAIICLVLVFFRRGAIILPFMILGCIPLLKALFKNPLSPQARIGAMAQICSVNIALGSFYAAAILASA